MVSSTLRPQAVTVRHVTACTVTAGPGAGMMATWLSASQERRWPAGRRRSSRMLRAEGASEAPLEAAGEVVHEDRADFGQDAPDRGRVFRVDEVTGAARGVRYWCEELGDGELLVLGPTVAGPSAPRTHGRSAGSDLGRSGCPTGIRECSASSRQAVITPHFGRVSRPRRATRVLCGQDRPDAPLELTPAGVLPDRERVSGRRVGVANRQSGPSTAHPSNVSG